MHNRVNTGNNMQTYPLEVVHLDGGLLTLQYYSIKAYVHKSNKIHYFLSFHLPYSMLVQTLVNRLQLQSEHKVTLRNPVLKLIP